MNDADEPIHALSMRVSPTHTTNLIEKNTQELCLECYRNTNTVLENRKVPPAHSEGAFEMLEHRKRQRAATLTQRAWLRFQSWVRKTKCREFDVFLEK